MLVIKRPIGKTLFINSNVGSITVLAVKRGIVKFGINAAQKIEVCDEKEQKKLSKEAVEKKWQEFKEFQLKIAESVAGVDPDVLEAAVQEALDVARKETDKQWANRKKVSK